MMAYTESRLRGVCATSSWTAIALVLALGTGQADAQAAVATSPQSAKDSLSQYSLTAKHKPATKAPIQLAQATSDQPATTVPQTLPTAGQPASENNQRAIVVVGARASQRSSINRKKDAETATDSIVADDIGSFPDRNVAEAMSRLPGVALGRNDFGEGDSVTIRGNSGGLVRVEMDGIQVPSTSGLAAGSADAGRTSNFQELPAALVQSIDVVKGSTADMTEGGLGGTVQIHTRTGLDFKKPYFSFETDEQKNTLDNKWTPSFTAVGTKKFFGDRLGIIGTVQFNHVINEDHEMQPTTSGISNYSRLIDFDNSPNKTFTFNPATVGTDAATQPIANSFQPNGQPGLTPLQLVTMSAGAQTKADCLTLFPTLTALKTATSTTAQNQRAERINEQMTCLSQWNDYTPSLIRQLMPSQDEKRLAVDLRADFRVNSHLTVYGKFTQANRKVDDQFRTFTPISLFNQNTAGTYDINFTPYPYQRTVSSTAPAGYYLFDPQYGLNNTGTSSNLATVNRNQPVLGNVLNVVPGSVMVDSAHNVTQMTLTNNTATVDQIADVINDKTRYYQGGAEYRSRQWEISAMAGLVKAKSTRGDMRTSRSYQYGDATITLQPNGLWDIQLPSTYDPTNMANFVQMSPATCIAGQKIPAPNCIGQAAVPATINNPATPAYTVGQMPLTSQSYAVQYTPQEGDSSEKIAKLDITFRPDGPFFTRFKAGAQYRDDVITKYSGPGATIQNAVGTFGQTTACPTSGNFNPATCYTPPIVIPRALIRGSYQACQPTATSTEPCNYGYVPSTNLGTTRQGTDTFTQQQLIALFQNSLEQGRSNVTFFGDYPNKGSLPPAWQGIDVKKLFQQLGAYQFMNFSCLKVCMANNGQMYTQPFTRTDEKTTDIYGMFDFEQRLPLGLVFNGNAGVRGVITKVAGSGSTVINHIVPVTPGCTGKCTTNTFSLTRETTLKSEAIDVLPSINLNLWAFHRSVVLRAYGGRTVSRPPVSDLVGSGTCTTDETNPADEESCSGRVGNPALKPYTANNYNLSLEWYPNRDTMFSAAYGKLDVKIGDPIAVTEVLTPFAGTDVVDPVTGQSLADIRFQVPTWENGPGYKRAIWEFATKTAFTFLPWFLRHTGVDANISILKTLVSQGIADPNSGDIMLPIGESKYFTNVSGWYDDGRLNVRVSWQHRTARFNCITPCTSNTNNNYPGQGYNHVALPYSPGVAEFIEPTSYIDAKITYNVTRNFQLYVEGRNLTAQAQTYSAGPYELFANGTPKVMRYTYAGRHILIGGRFQFGAPKESR